MLGQTRETNGETVREFSKKDAGAAVLYAFKIFEGINMPNCITYTMRIG
jgi:hypothetical protein